MLNLAQIQIDMRCTQNYYLCTCNKRISSHAFPCFAYNISLLSLLFGSNYIHYTTGSLMSSLSLLFIVLRIRCSVTK